MKERLNKIISLRIVIVFYMENDVLYSIRKCYQTLKCVFENTLKRF